MSTRALSTEDKITALSKMFGAAVCKIHDEDGDVEVGLVRDAKTLGNIARIGYFMDWRYGEAKEECVLLISAEGLTYEDAVDTLYANAFLQDEYERCVVEYPGSMEFKDYGVVPRAAPQVKITPF